jgi:hypothetical protein
MGGRNSSTARRRYRRSRRLHANGRGVVAVIGTLLALLVFFALFGVFLTQYLPVWMADNESQFVGQAAGAFAQFKSDVDLQYALGGPSVMGNPFVLASQGVPLLAQPTEGTLAFLPTSCPPQQVTVGSTTSYFSFYTAGLLPAGKTVGQPVNQYHCVFENVTIGYGPGGIGTPYYQRAAGGSLEMILPNRYYSAETYYFEDDAVIQSQVGGYQVMLYAPPFNITTLASNTTITTSFLQSFGNSSTIVGQGSQELYSHLRYTQFLTSNGKYNSGTRTFLNTNFSIEIGTQFPCAWYSFFRHQMNVSNLPSADYTLTANGTAGYPPQSTCLNPNSYTTIVWLKITAFVVDYVQLYYAGIQVSTNVGGS